MNLDCIFCLIVRGELPASVVYEIESIFCFMDIRPVNPGHVLVIPRIHVSYLADLDPKLGGELFRAAMRIAAALHESGVQCEGVNLFLADEEVEGQEVFHTHLHVIPRKRRLRPTLRCELRKESATRGTRRHSGKYQSGANGIRYGWAKVVLPPFHKG
jgi:histidine triad (HIT) family protein